MAKFNKSDLLQIAKMVVELQQDAVPTEIATSQAAGVPTGLLDAARWLRENKPWAKNAAKVTFAKYEKAVYFRLLDSKGKALGDKNRQLRRSGKGYFSIPFGTHKLADTTTVNL